MKKVAVVFWSGTGNTEAMATAVVNGAKSAGAETEIFNATEFSSSKADEFDVIAFGCPAMGAEVLEEEEFEPMFNECLPALKDKGIALFGSYGWGDCEWMRNWEDVCTDNGAKLLCDSVICTDSPDEQAITACENLGKKLAE